MGNPVPQERFQPCADLAIDFGGPIEHLFRGLDLDKAVHTTRFVRNGVTVTQETFAPYTEPDFIFHRIVADRPGAVACEIALTTPHAESVLTAEGDALCLDGCVMRGGVAFAVSRRQGRAGIPARAAVRLEGG